MLYFKACLLYLYMPACMLYFKETYLLETFFTFNIFYLYGPGRVQSSSPAKRYSRLNAHSLYQITIFIKYAEPCKYYL